VLEAVGIADGYRNLANAQCARIAEPRVRKRGAVSFLSANDREISVGIVANQRRRHRLAIGERHPTRSTGRDDVTVSQSEPIRREDKSRTASASGFDLYDGWSDCLDGVNDGTRIGVKKLEIVPLNRDGPSMVHVLIVETRPPQRTTHPGGDGALCQRRGL
jgi:hypothetical protein